MADPLTREERDDHLRQPLLAAYGSYVEALRDGYEATVQAAEERAERLRAALGAVKYTEGDARPIARAALAADDAARGDR